MADHIIVGEYSDHSGISEMVYGPFAGEEAQQVAQELSEGGWHGMRWSAIPLHRLPGQRRQKPVPDAPIPRLGPSDDQLQLYKILEQRTSEPEPEPEPEEEENDRHGH